IPRNLLPRHHPVGARPFHPDGIRCERADAACGQRRRDRGDVPDRTSDRLVQDGRPDAGSRAGGGLAAAQLRSRGRRRGSCFGIPALALAAPFLGLLPARAEHECEVPPEMLQGSVKLPHLAARLKAHEPVNIVAIGGASTTGTAAGSPELAYPHRLQVALAKLFPDAAITVVNKGVPRQSTRQMIGRFATDVIPEDPVLVIWETGISDAVRGIEVEEFAAALQAG